MLLQSESPKRLSEGIQQYESSKLQRPTSQTGLALGHPLEVTHKLACFFCAMIYGMKYKAI